MERSCDPPSLLRWLKPLLFGLVPAMGCAMLFTLLFTLLLTLGVPDGWIPFFAHASVLLGAVAGGLSAGLKGREQGLLLGCITGIALFAVHFLLMLFLGGLSLACLTYALAETLGGALGGILGVNLRK